MAGEHEEPADFNVVRMVAGLTIQAALQFDPDSESPHLAARGWMPPPATGAPEIEYGAAFAVRALIYAFDLPPEQVALIGGQLIP